MLKLDYASIPDLWLLFAGASEHISGPDDDEKVEKAQRTAAEPANNTVQSTQIQGILGLLY